MNIRKYFERIQYSGDGKPNLKTLFELHRLHVTHIPFENIDIMNGDKIILDEERLFEKIISEKRGGICYELNGLYYGLLKRLGFEVILVSAITLYKDYSYGDEFDHMALVVKCEKNNWLVDVGLRDSMTSPVLIKENAFDGQILKTYHIEKSENYFRLIKTCNDIPFEEYKFSSISRNLGDFQSMCLFHEHNPRSPLNQYLFCSIASEDSIVCLKKNVLTIQGSANKFVMEFRTDVDFNKNVEVCCRIFNFNETTVSTLKRLIERLIQNVTTNSPLPLIIA